MIVCYNIDIIYILNKILLFFKKLHLFLNKRILILLNLFYHQHRVFLSKLSIRGLEMHRYNPVDIMNIVLKTQLLIFRN
jgi:hypothetical protein